MKKNQKNHFWDIALFTRFNLHILDIISNAYYEDEEREISQPKSKQVDIENVRC